MYFRSGCEYYFILHSCYYFFKYGINHVIPLIYYGCTEYDIFHDDSDDDDDISYKNYHTCLASGWHDVQYLGN